MMAFGERLPDDYQLHRFRRLREIGELDPYTVVIALRAGDLPAEEGQQLVVEGIRQAEQRLANETNDAERVLIHMGLKAAQSYLAKLRQQDSDQRAERPAA